MVGPIQPGATSLQQTISSPAGQDQNAQIRNTEQANREVLPDEIQGRSEATAQSQSSDTDVQQGTTASRSDTEFDANAPRGSIVDLEL